MVSGNAWLNSVPIDPLDATSNWNTELIWDSNSTSYPLNDNSRKGKRLRAKKAKNPKSNFEKPWKDKTWNERMRRK